MNLLNFIRGVVAKDKQQQIEEAITRHPSNYKKPLIEKCSYQGKDGRYCRVRKDHVGSHRLEVKQ
jgi:hypothetical protein